MTRSSQAAQAILFFTSDVSHVVTYSWEQLLLRTGFSNENEVLVVLGPAKPRSRLLREGRALYGQRRHEEARWALGVALDFLPGATPTQRRMLGDVTATSMRATVWAAWHSETLYARHHRGVDAALDVRIPLPADWEATRSSAIRRRDVLRNTLRTWLGDLPELAAPSAASDDAMSLAVSLTRMLHLARETLADPSLADVTHASAITEEWLDAQQELVTELKLAARADAPVTVQSVSPHDVHHWDAVAVTLLERLAAAFEFARSIDGSIPTLAYPIANDSTAEPDPLHAPVNDVDDGLVWPFNDAGRV